ncbi:hypothetical protein AB0468_25975, partial [Streptomyces sp. NPDC091278]
MRANTSRARRDRAGPDLTRPSRADPARCAPTPPPAGAGELVVVPVRHPWRWVAVTVTAVLLVQFVHGL